MLSVLLITWEAYVLWKGIQCFKLIFLSAFSELLQVDAMETWQNFTSNRALKEEPICKEKCGPLRPHALFLFGGYSCNCEARYFLRSAPFLMFSLPFFTVYWAGERFTVVWSIIIFNYNQNHLGLASFPRDLILNNGTTFLEKYSGVGSIWDRTNVVSLVWVSSIFRWYCVINKMYI